LPTQLQLQPVAVEKKFSVDRLTILSLLTLAQRLIY